MKILMIHQDRDQLYGAVHSMLELLTHLHEDFGVEIIVLTTKKGNVSNYCQKKGFECHITGHVNFMIGADTKRKKIIRNILLPLFYLRYKVKNKLALKRIEEELDFSDIDIIHTNVNVCDIGAELSKKYHIPHCWHLREYGSFVDNRAILKRSYINYMNQNCDVFFAISNVVKDYWINKGLLPEKVKVVYNGVLPVAKSEINNKNNKINMCFAGSIKEGKGQHLLIEALYKLSEEELEKIDIDIIGDGPNEYLNSLKKKVKKYGLVEVVHFLGYKKNVRDLLTKYDVGFMCTKNEGFGRVTIEYMMAGMCVIASDKGANLELIQDKETGLLFECSNIKSLKEKIKWVIANYDEAKKIGLVSQKYANEHFTSLINAKKVYMQYESLKSGKNE